MAPSATGSFLRICAPRTSGEGLTVGSGRVGTDPKEPPSRPGTGSGERSGQGFQWVPPWSVGFNKHFGASSCFRETKPDVGLSHTPQPRE